MARIAKWVGVSLGVLVLMAAGFMTWVELTWSMDRPDTPYPHITASSDPEVIARGEYVVHALAHCSTCHTDGATVRDHDIDFAAPLIGGYTWHIGPFGHFTAPNITPHASGIGNMSDAELARAIRHAVGRNGQLLPMMMLAVGPMSDDDLVAVISWLRAQEPVASSPPPGKFGFLAKALSKRFHARMADAPAFAAPGELSIERGRYLAKGPALCSGCHTPLDPMTGFAPAGPLFSGATAEPDGFDPAYEIAAPNLTPDAQTGHIFGWSEDTFVERFGAGRMMQGSKMPWEAYGLMTESDVRSIYRYLRSLPAAFNDIGPTRRVAGTYQPASGAP
jgi:mono/diheme cytochrome c family protein